MKKASQNKVRTTLKPKTSWLQTYIINAAKFSSTLIVLAFFALGFLVYSNTFESPFIFDDQSKIINNPDIRLEQLSVQGLWDAAFGRFSAKSRPIGNISFALNYYFHQLDPAGYHFVNIMVHILSGILLWLFLKKTLGLNVSSVDKNRGDWIALIAAMIWLVNPVQTQSVTYIVQRLNSMAAMFFLLSFLFYLNGRLATQNGPRWAWFAGAAMGWILALGCKQNTATLPFFILLYEWYFFQDLNAAWLKKNLKYFYIILTVFILVSFIYLGANPIQRLMSIGDYANHEFSLTERILTQFRVVIYYLSLILYPNPIRLNLDYDFPLSHSLFDPATTLPALFGLIGLGVLGVLLAKKQRLISFCIFWFLGNLVIESSIIPIAIIFEHRLYLPSMLVWLVPLVFIRRYVKSEWIIVGLGCVVLVPFSYWTFERNKVWRSAVTLWADCVKKSPNKARPYNNLGTAQHRQNMDEAARQNILKALALDPNFADAHYNLGRILEDDGAMTEAIEHYRKAIELKPGSMWAHNNLGAALLKQNKPSEAVEHFIIALRINPADAQAHHNLGLARIKEGKIDAAIAHYKAALELNSNLVQTHFNLGGVLIRQGQKEQGVYHLQQALQLNPDHDLANTNMAGYLLNQGKLDEAAEHLERAIKVNPDLAEAHNNLGIISVRKGNHAAAISHFQEALRIDPDFELAKNNLQRALAIREGRENDVGQIQEKLAARPDDPELHFNLGNVYLGQRELGKAIVEFEKALALRPSFLAAQNNLAMAYAADQQYGRALAAFKKLVELDPANSVNYYNIAVLYALQNKVPDSVEWLKKAIDQGYHNWDLVKTDPDLANIRNSVEYQQLVKGH